MLLWLSELSGLCFAPWHTGPSRTSQKRETFLARLADGASVTQAAAAIGAGRATMYDWRAADEAFRTAWDEAVESATEVIKSVLYNQAREGNLLACIFWLKSHKPCVYNRKQVVAIGGDPDAPPISVDTDQRVVIYMPSNLRDRPEEPEPPLIEDDAA